MKMMVAQLVFFVALVLFLILLVRRFRSTDGRGEIDDQPLAKTLPVVDRTGSATSNLGRSIIRFGSRVGGQIVEQSKRVRQGIPLLSDRQQKVGTIAERHHFWQEKPIGDRPEVAGFYDEGDLLFKKGEFDKAEEFFLKAATRTPGDARVYARLGVIYLNAKNYSDAIEALKVAVKLDQYNPSRHYNLALAYHGNNDRQKAISSTREAIALDPVTKKYRSLLEQLLERK